MKLLYSDRASAGTVPAMRLEQFAVVTDTTKADINNNSTDKYPDLVLLTAKTDSTWVMGENATVPTTEEDGHWLPEGAQITVWLNYGETLAVKGSISVSW